MSLRYLTGTVLLFAVLVAGGCGGGKQETRGWSAHVNAKGTSAVVFVDVQGKRMGQEYHPHLSLDAGPEVMMYSPTYTFSNLKPGPHKVRVIIADPKHNPIAGMEKTLDVEIK